MAAKAPALHRFTRQGISLEGGIRFFFASNAGLTIVILVLIIAFLLKEGLGFFPGYRRELEVYRVAGLEFVDLSRGPLTSHEQLASVLNRAYYAEINGRAAKELKRMLESSELFNAYSEGVAPPRDLILKNLENGVDPNSEMLVQLRERFAERQARALNSLPPTPHLTIPERAALVADLRRREVTATEDPALVTVLADEYGAARQRFAEPLSGFREVIDSFESAGSDLSDLVMDMTETVTVTKEAIQRADILEKDRSSLLAAAANTKDPAERERLTADAEAALAETPDIAGPMQTLMARKPDCAATHAALREALAGITAKLPSSLTRPEANRLLQAAHKGTPILLAELAAAPARINEWRSDKPVPLSMAIRRFLTGKDWVTGGEWQDFYGILPLFVGSLMVSVVALIIAIPLGIGAAIYVNQFSARLEQSLIKPVIEFIQAIPSVVLGFIGILVLGTVLREVSQVEWLAWVPGFPIEERLNIFTAGCLLALMSIPTIFSLAEDALNNVPAAYAEASDALGASRFQTTFRVIVPAAYSGMLVAVLLGLGRVIGETMVVLLVAGNRIKIPDFSSGIGSFFQPAHTLTGIIAQELGEVPLGSVHYRALFVVGILLFVIVLGINATAHRFFNRTPI
ncbi:MAG: phosphate ABC transporter permease subunit PstC [Akkermansiaceae bacterium]|nr:phosphate ABC transporter permease subunit PstC [Akkermansiaceae bacterium]